jgi:segregation and condensation protein B
MSEPDASEEPAPPEIDPKLLRATEAPAAESAASADAAAPVEEAAAPPPSADDPELPGVALATRVEALLFVATEPLPLRRLKELLRVEDGRAVREALDALAADYAAAGRAVRIDEVAGGFQLKTREELAPLVARAGRKVEKEKLSPAALETLAIVAYRQPVLRADVERIRGVASGEVLHGLLERGLVRVAGHAELPGSPRYYGTTNRFLEIFGLRDLQDLPRDADALRPAGS